MDITSIFGKIQLKRLLHRGLKLGKNVYVHSQAYIDNDLCWLVSIGDDCVLSKDVMILAHDASPEKQLGYGKIDKVKIGCRTYIGAGTIILPGVTIGNDVIVGAGSVVTHDIPDDSVAAGNPARVIKSTSKYIEEHRKNLPTRLAGVRRQALQSPEGKRIIKKALKDGACYI